MIQDIYPHIYDNAFSHSTGAEGYAVSFSNGSVLASVQGGELLLPETSLYPGFTGDHGTRFLFLVDGIPYYLAPRPLPEKGGFRYVQVSSIRRSGISGYEAYAVFCAQSLSRWYTDNIFCGRCGSRMDDSVTERALVCPSCGLTVYPRINPAVIVGVVHGDSLLVTHYRGRPYRHLALVAGFSEIGESCEDTVRREVREETGIDVGSVLFYKSQPWPISDSLLMGFFAEADNPGKIAVQETELSEAHWCPRDQLPVGSGFSLTEEMMDRFRTAGSPF